jgi:OOP family OmpA-OmpF porin
MKLIFATAAAPAVLAASPAFAADDTGFYVGAGLGNFAANSDRIYAGRDFDGSDLGFKVFGGYQFLKWLAVEAEYIDGGEPDDNYDSGDEQLSLSVGVTGFVGSAVGILPIGESFNVFGKLGFIYWDADGHGDIKSSGSEVEKVNVGDDGTDFAWGVGGSWNFSDTFGLRAEYQGFELSNFDSVDFASASFVWRF